MADNESPREGPCHATTTVSPPAPSTPARTPTRPPARPSCRSTPPRPTPRQAPGQHKGYEYSRSGNPTRTALETCLAALEGGERGLAFASGLAATTAVLSHARPGDEVAAAADLYGGTFRLLERVFKPWGLVARYTDDPSPGRLRARSSRRRRSWSGSRRRPTRSCKSSTSPPSPSWPTRPARMLAVDNTFASPYLQQPLELGADLVVHSTTKYLGGHSDVVGGAVIGRKRAAGADRVLPERGRRRAGAVRRLADAARPQDAGRAHGAALRQRPAAGRLAGRAAAGASRSTIPGLPDHPGHDAGQAADARLRRHDQRCSLQGRHGRGPAVHDADASCSAWPRAWAASSRWSATRRR